MEDKDLAQIDKGKGFTKIFLSRREVVVNNFLGGLAWGLGTALGAGVIFAILIWVFGQLGAIPFLGEQINQVIQQIDTSTLVPSPE